MIDNAMKTRPALILGLLVGGIGGCAQTTLPAWQFSQGHTATTMLQRFRPLRRLGQNSNLEKPTCLASSMRPRSTYSKPGNGRGGSSVNKTVQRTGASRLAQKRIGCPRRLAPAADIALYRACLAR